MPEVNPKQPETLQLAVAGAIEKKNTDWKMVILCRDPKSRALGEVVRMPIREAVDIVQDLPDWIRANHGSGEFSVRLANGAGTEEAEYTYRIFGAPPYNTGMHRTGGDGGKSKDEGTTSILAQFVLKALESKDGDPLKYMEAMAGMFERMRPQEGGTDEFRDKVLSTLMDNFFVQKQNMFADLRDAMEFAKTMQPQIPPEDPTTAILSSIAPMLTALITNRTGMSASQVMPGIVEQIQEIQQLAAAGDMQRVQAKLSGILGSAGLSPAGVALPHPGESQPRQIAGAHTSQAGAPEQGPQPQPTQSVTEDPHHTLVESMIQQFRDDIRSSVDPRIQANTLIGIIEYNRGLRAPHRLLAGLVNAGVDDYEREFERFCAAVPELAGNPQAKLALGTALTMLLLERHGEWQGEDEEDVQEDSDVDGSGPSGLRESGDGDGAPGDGAGPEEQSEGDGVQAGGVSQTAA